MTARDDSASGQGVCPGDERGAGVARRELLADGACGKLAARLYKPQQADDDTLIVCFPPGGFVEDELEAIDMFLRALAADTRCRVLASAYTLAQERPFPAAVEDAYAVLKWAKRQRMRLGWSGRHMISAGIEAGGNLAAVSALMARDRGGPPLAAQLLIMPMLDPNLSTGSMRKMSTDNGVVRAVELCVSAYRGYLPRAIDRAHPYASPLQSSRMSGLPPALILSADDDPLRDEAEQYGTKLISAGIKTLVKRLPPIALDEPDARCSCARQEDALREIRHFIHGLQAEARKTSDLQK
ncbi:MAG TPA: alpha/beta hydrolase [Paucimonas sp.]|nr:alpha/beta hydrolase [Paucimonas sp.]